MIEYYDGETLVKALPTDSVPAHLRRLPRTLPSGETEMVPVARVVRLLIGPEGESTSIDKAVRVMIQEFDAKGAMLRETVQLRG